MQRYLSDSDDNFRAAGAKSLKRMLFRREVHFTNLIRGHSVARMLKVNWLRMFPSEVLTDWRRALKNRQFVEYDLPQLWASFAIVITYLAWIGHLTIR
ncbi:hypothetical protein EA797_04425 [Stutzerimonas zhaodongensis]|uniref:Uncharacterized protein n=1 Tax=Stutzerimonas zhaodongensis TaxID=1176257 RepID=A0A3M2HVZ6_9GAMM|nr:hypothetical protein EA797_04425 [Stutzerimonas zhaodongensis]